MSFSFCVPLSDTSAKQNLQVALVPLNESFFWHENKEDAGVTFLPGITDQIKITDCFDIVQYALLKLYISLIRKVLKPMVLA